jgi:hypothetical protein
MPRVVKKAACCEDAVDFPDSAEVVDQLSTLRTLE